MKPDDRNKALALGSAISAMTNNEIGYWTTSSYKAIPVTTLGRLIHNDRDVDSLRDEDREPFLISREAFNADMHPLIELLDYSTDIVEVTVSGKKESRALVSIMSGDALLPLDTLLAWRK